MRGCKFQSQIFGLSVKIFRNFRDCFQTVWAEFQDCFRTIQIEFLGLFLNSLNKIFGTEFGFGFNPETDAFEFFRCVLVPQ